MIQYLAHIFIKNHQDYANIKVREQYGSLCSILSIICNITLVCFKITMGFITHSVAIMADGFNNLSDVGSNLASLFGFKLSNKHADSEHPYGHGRYEYIAGLVISFLILLLGIQSLKDSVLKIIYPEKVLFSWIAVIILIASIFIKLWMYHFNAFVGKKIDSSTLKAASQDSLNDVMTTFATLCSLVLTLFTTLPVDGIFGTIVSIIVLKAGVEVFKDTVNPLLGLAPDKEFIQEIKDFIMSFDKPLGVHDILLHDYGPGRLFLTLHVEVNCHDDMMVVHDQIDLIERGIHEKFHILTTIHMDPIDVENKDMIKYRDLTQKIVHDLNPEYSIHDFRMVPGKTHTNLIFDVVVPPSDQINHQELKNMITKKIQEQYPYCFTVIQIDHNYM